VFSTLTSVLGCLAAFAGIIQGIDVIARWTASKKQGAGQRRNRWIMFLGAFAAISVIVVGIAAFFVKPTIVYVDKPFPVDRPVIVEKQVACPPSITGDAVARGNKSAANTGSGSISIDSGTPKH
jgi:hypothetical protein